MYAPELISEEKSYYKHHKYGGHLPPSWCPHFRNNMSYIKQPTKDIFAEGTKLICYKILSGQNHTPCVERIIIKAVLPSIKLDVYFEQ